LEKHEVLNSQSEAELQTKKDQKKEQKLKRGKRKNQTRSALSNREDV